MKKTLLFQGAVAAAFVLGYFISGQRWHRHYAAEIQRLEQQWQQQGAAAVAEAMASSKWRRPAGERDNAGAAGAPRVAAADSAAVVPSVSPALGLSSPREILARIRELQQSGGPNSQRAIQRLLSELVLAGPQSLEAIREFLAAGEDMKLDAQGKGKAGGGKAGWLRQELLQVVQEIGGEQAEQLLAQVMTQAASPQEMLRLAKTLEKMAPGKYQQAAIAAANAQLATAANTKGDIGPSLEILAMYGDHSYVQQAQANLVQPDGRINKDALDYLQSVLKQDFLPVAQQLFQDPRLADAKLREELSRLAAEYVGRNEQANQMWYQSALSSDLPDKTRDRLIRDLEKKGFQDPKNPTPQDVQLAQARLQLLEHLRNQIQASSQLGVLDETRLRLAAMVDPNLRQSLQATPKANKPPR
ncbi:MAG: hypothetical protein N3J91_05370 [Verrucomicrobiae bacterium]|nr:hypothetical protein [Verrucomicrobiae bacterium]